MRINCVNNLNFGKTVLNQTKIRTARNNTERVDFVEYDPKNTADRGTINCIGLYWRTNPTEAEHIRRLSSNFERAGLDEEALPDTHFYGLENMWGSPIAIAQITNKKKAGKNHAEIDYIQTAPDEKYSSSRRKYRGAGETLTAQIIQELQHETDVIELTSLAEGFWSSSNLFERKTESNSLYPERYMESRNFPEYIQYVEDKTKPRISYWS